MTLIVGLPTRQDSQTFWDKGTTGKAQNLVTGWGGPGQPIKIRDRTRNGTRDRTQDGTRDGMRDRAITIFFPMISCFRTSFPILECTFPVLEDPFLSFFFFWKVILSRDVNLYKKDFS